MTLMGRPSGGADDNRSSLSALRRVALLVAGLLLVLAAAGLLARGWSGGAEARLDQQAAEFVSIALDLGRIAPEEVDAYFGSEKPAPAVEGSAPTLASLHARAAQLQAAIAADAEEAGQAERRERLSARASALAHLLDGLARGERTGFDEQAEQVYGVRDVSGGGVDGLIARRLDTLLPGEGPLPGRIEIFRAQFVIPQQRRAAVFERALEECRKRTLAHWRLPADEHVAIEWSSAAPAAWHRYEGHHRSTLRINPAAVADPAAAIDVACHEGYPGHHAQFVAMDAAAPGGLRVEDRVVLLRSPDTMLREGAANYGVELAFPEAERLAFTRDVLFPLAGLPTRDVARYEEVHRLVSALSASTLPILRDYHDRRLPFAQAVTALERDALISSPAALLAFTDQLGAYAIGYTVAAARVRSHVEVEAQRWRQDAWAALRTTVVRRPVAALNPLLCRSTLAASAPSALPAP